MSMLDKAKSLAVTRGGECLAKDWPGINTKIEWRCSHAHEWFATYNSVCYEKSWCRRCATAARAQILRERAFDIMQVSAQKQSFRCNTSKEEYINVIQKINWTCLLCSRDFCTSWKALATTSKFRCDSCFRPPLTRAEQCSKALSIATSPEVAS